MASSDDTVRLLARVGAFASLDRSELAQISALCVPRGFDAAQVIFREGDRGDTCYVIRSGSVRVSRTAAAGREVTLAELGQNSIFGELAMFDSQLRSATVTALEPTQALALSAGDMRHLVATQPPLATSLLRALAGRLREANDRLLSLSSQPVTGRVAQALLSRVEAEASRGTGGAIVNITQHELARLAGSSRESTSRSLAMLARDGVVTPARGRVVVHDPDALQSYIY